MLPVKTRSILAVYALGLLTCGLYFFYWYYRVNEEAALLANDRHAKPLRSVLALALGPLVIPPLVSAWRTADRVGYATKSLPNPVETLLFTLTGVFYPLWIQLKLNRHIGAVERRARQVALSQNFQSRVVGVGAEISAGPGA